MAPSADQEMRIWDDRAMIAAGWTAGRVPGGAAGGGAEFQDKRARS